MTTIPSRLARVSQSSGSLLDARRRVVQLYRDWYRSETMNCWKQEPHIMGILLRDLHEGSAVGQTFLQKFYAGRDEESVRIASPQQ
ncbi:NADH-ubiquinone oxidoreductase 14,8 kDa subunit [Rhizoctonia solani]|uniref:NADH-ubiquinone oxidoreductase 14,8 kDa subunit n=1 Tax=Rhizoctonia solani TaxID=456999 RepID=A0A8H8P2J5_9AGAM|nr:NADH-ubiquinone oxidoreductase 14,8 kDa subunit [Rhizoctonia solani]QRW23448.1 NADH-ubiquinone oxidoreductase 14,8 kDa subunit [Rhizoctonia solani]